MSHVCWAPNANKVTLYSFTIAKNSKRRNKRKESLPSLSNLTIPHRTSSTQVLLRKPKSVRERLLLVSPKSCSSYSPRVSSTLKKQFPVIERRSVIKRLRRLTQAIKFTYPLIRIKWFYRSSQPNLTSRNLIQFLPHTDWRHRQLTQKV